MATPGIPIGRASQRRGYTRVRGGYNGTATERRGDNRRRYRSQPDF
jgi:hypothetical protein